MSEGSITHWFGDLRKGDDAAVAAVYDRYFDRLVAFARTRLQSIPRRTADEEDVALSALNCLATRAADGKCDDMTDRTDLWRLLMTITANKASDERKRQSAQKRGGGNVRGESVFLNADGESPAGLGEFAKADPSPESVARLNEQLAELFAGLPDDTLREVARLRLEGHSVEEIAKELTCTKRTVIRKLNRIREKWTQLHNDDHE